MSKPITAKPDSEKRWASGRPTYPRPTMPMRASRAWIFASSASFAQGAAPRECGCSDSRSIILDLSLVDVDQERVQDREFGGSQALGNEDRPGGAAAPRAAVGAFA